MLKTSARTPTLTIGTRGSSLARAQSESIGLALEACWPELRLSTKVIRTEGDRKLDVSTLKLGKGVFVKEIEHALLNGDIDLAVHSCKDLPTDTVPGLTLAAFPKRANPLDTLVSRNGLMLDDLPAHSVIGTSSSRRKAQLLMRRPDLRVVDIRGNIDTRLRKLRSGEYDAIILAAAGLDRLGWLHQATQLLAPEIMLPAPAQGALAIQVRENDQETMALLKRINDPVTEAAVRAERAFLRALGGGCHVPIAAFADVQDGQLILNGLVATSDGSQYLRGQRIGSTVDHMKIGSDLAAQLLREGAARLLRPQGPDLLSDNG